MSFEKNKETIQDLVAEVILNKLKATKENNSDDLKDWVAQARMFLKDNPVANQPTRASPVGVLKEYADAIDEERPQKTAKILPFA